MILLVVSWTSLGYSQTVSEIEYIADYVPSGYITVEPGYWLDMYSGKRTFQALRTYRLENEHLQESYDNVFAEYQTFAQSVDDKITKIEKDLATERKEWKKALRKAKAPGFGVFAGPAYNFSDNGVQLVVGFGLVWKIW